jgi:REP element-mobilizing transposase RayT
LCDDVEMARHLRVEFPGAIYHVTCRMIGDGRLENSRLFTEDRERERFLERLGEGVEQYNIRLYQFVLMTNHFHLVFETPEGNCSKFMHSLSTAYTVFYNLRHGRHGHLLDGRFKAKLVDGDNYLLALTRYVHLNPVMAGEMKTRPVKEKIQYLRQYPWSSYPSYTGDRKGYDFVTYGPILGEMSGKRRTWPRRYREFVEAGLAENDKEFEKVLKASPRSIGGVAFRTRVDTLYEKVMAGHGATEDIAFRHITEPLRADAVLNMLAAGLNVEKDEFCRRQRGSMLRAVAARYLMKYAAQSQRDVAKVLNAGSGSAISKQLAQYKNMSGDGSLAKALAGVDRRLEEARSRRREPPTNS